MLNVEKGIENTGNDVAMDEGCADLSGCHGPGTPHSGKPSFKATTVYEALDEISLLKKKIEAMETELKPILFASAIKTKDTIRTGEKKSDIESVAKSYMDTYKSYLNRLNLLQGLVDQSNVKTPITVGSITYPSIPFALARYRKIDKEILFWSQILKKAKEVKSEVAKFNDRNLSEDSIKNAIPQGMDWTVEQIEDFKTKYIASVEMEVFDPLKLLENNEIVNILNNLKEFKENFHTELSKVNLTTIIMVPVDEPKL